MFDALGWFLVGVLVLVAVMALVGAAATDAQAWQAERAAQQPLMTTGQAAALCGVTEAVWQAAGVGERWSMWSCVHDALWGVR